MNKVLHHCMIDLETMGLTPDSAIVSIGAVIFDPRYQVTNKHKTFYVELDWESQGRHCDPKTKIWWAAQGDKARCALNGLEELPDVLTDLSDFLPGDVRVWGNGPTFDISILEDTYRQCNIEIPWKFWNVRDCRTVLDMYESKRGGLNRGLGGIKHNALDDAINQANNISKMWKELLGEKK